MPCVNKALNGSVALSGDLLVVGAEEVDAGDLDEPGAAYLFRLESNGSVTELAKVTALRYCSERLTDRMLPENNWSVVTKPTAMMARATTTSNRENPWSALFLVDADFSSDWVDGDGIKVFRFPGFAGFQTDGSAGRVSLGEKFDFECFVLNGF